MMAAGSLGEVGAAIEGRMTAPTSKPARPVEIRVRREIMSVFKSFML
jgi:hypothetical protein